MKETVMQIDSQVQAAKSKEGKYLAFAFFEKDCGLELEVIGWTQFQAQPNKPDYIKGAVHPWGSEIPVIDLGVLYGKDATEMTDTACIVIFEHTEQYKYYFAMVVEELSNVINIANGTENKMSPLLLSAKKHLSSSPSANDWNTVLSQLIASVIAN